MNYKNNITKLGITWSQCGNKSRNIQRGIEKKPKQDKSYRVICGAFLAFEVGVVLYALLGDLV